MGLTLVSAALWAVVACHDAPNPVGPRASFDVGGETVNADSIQLSYLCGNRFRVRSYNDAPAEVKWEVDQTADSGRVTVPARAGGGAFGEVFFTTTASGTVRLRFEETQVDTAANEGASCPPGAVVPAIPPDSYPTALIDSLGFVEMAATGRQFVRGMIMVGFEPSITQAQRQAAIDQIRGTVVGGKRQSADEGYYYVRLPGDGSYEEIEQALAVLLALPQVEIALEWSLSPPGAHPPNAEGWSGRMENLAHRSDVGLGAETALEATSAPMVWDAALEHKA